MAMDASDIKNRTRSLGVKTIRMVESLPKSKTADIIGTQMIRCATSVGANYRAACRAHSHADFIAKLGIGEEEVDEVIYWLEVLSETGIAIEERMCDRRDEANRIVAMVVSSINTARRRSGRIVKPAERKA